MPSPRQSAAPPPFEQSRDFVQSLARGLSVLAAFDAEHPTLSLAGIATRTGLSRAAARRLVLTLQHLGYVRPLGREFALSPRVLELGFGCLSSLKLTDLAQPLVEQLAQRLHHSCSMAVLDGPSSSMCCAYRCDA
jgi:IclR family pca regulon transcriptional regulator